MEVGEKSRQDQLKAADLYCKSARLGNAEASFRLGWMYANGRGVEQDDGFAVALIQRSSAMGYDVPDRLLQFLQTSNVRLPECMKATSGSAVRTATVAKAAAVKASVAMPKSPAIEPSAVLPTTKLSETTEASVVRDQIAAAIKSWAEAWSNQDLSNYFAAYAETYRAPTSKSRIAWEEDRRARIMGKAKITVAVDQLQIRVTGATAKARFLQHYQSDRLNQRIQKSLVLAEVNGRWLIQEENVEAEMVASGS
jgi:ketosteroid isomerase-like protein